jgi:hypothetical protein
MRRITYACDRCGSAIDSGRSVIAIQAGAAPPSWSTDPETGRAAIDLCGPCMDGLAGGLRRPNPSGERSRV